MKFDDSCLLILNLWPLIFDLWPFNLDLWSLTFKLWSCTFELWSLTFKYDQWPNRFNHLLPKNVQISLRNILELLETLVPGSFRDPSRTKVGKNAPTKFPLPRGGGWWLGSFLFLLLPLFSFSSSLLSSWFHSSFDVSLEVLRCHLTFFLWSLLKAKCRFSLVLTEGGVRGAGWGTLV